MVLLLMKLDQLDQEIENALSVTSSMDSTPTLHRRQLLVLTCIWICLYCISDSFSYKWLNKICCTQWIWGLHSFTLVCPLVAIMEHSNVYRHPSSADLLFLMICFIFSWHNIESIHYQICLSLVQELDLGSAPAALQNPTHPHVPTSSTSGPTPALGAKPKSGVSQKLCIILSYIYITARRDVRHWHIVCENCIGEILSERLWKYFKSK